MMLASTQCMGRQPLVLGIVSSIVTPKKSGSWTYHAEESPSMRSKARGMIAPVEAFVNAREVV
jgi:hypothetical protein